MVDSQVLTAEEKVQAAEQELSQRLESPTRPKGVWATLTAIGVLSLKGFKSAFLVLKFLKLNKLLITGSTMGLMIWTYSFRYGWPFAVGFVFLILVHEQGHGWAAKTVGLEVGSPIFIPFVGAFIALKDKPRSAYEDFIIGAGGPIAGVSGGLLCLILSPQMSYSWRQLLLSLGYVVLVTNLFNLTPLGFLDGSRMVSPFGKTEWLIGFPILLFVAYFSLGSGDHLNPVVFFVLIFAALRAASTLLKKDPVASSERITPKHRLIAFLTYFGLTSMVIYIAHIAWDQLPR